MTEPFLREITPGNLLSFGPNPEPIKLNQLNILIGANGSGKSNLIEVIHVLRSTPGDLRSAFRPGFSDWIWKGELDTSPILGFSIKHYKHDHLKIDHVLALELRNQTFSIERESVFDFTLYGGKVKYMVNDLGVFISDLDKFNRVSDRGIMKDLSVLSLIQDPERFPELYFLADNYKKMRIYREWQFGRNSLLRLPQSTDNRHEILEEDFSNLAMHLNYLRSFPAVRRKLIEKLQNVFAGITDFDVSVVGGTAQIYLIEGDYRIPATRLSDGTLRYLCLLAILCNPEPQPLICLEEPELGLHPDLLSGLVDLIKECSERTQMIVTTHSEFIVDGFSESPECVMVVDKEDGITKMTRLNYDSLKVWLEKYSLGQLWNQGQIGGTRW